MVVSAGEISLLTKVVGRFENSGDPYQGVTGDFDGQGISCGVLQWNLGQGSLQPMVKTVGQAHVKTTMPNFGTDMWKACNGSIQTGLQIVRAWQSDNKLRAGPASELRALMGSAPMKAEQDKRILSVATKADGWAAAWATSRGTGARTKQELVWFFDIATQNGSMKNLDFSDVKSFKAATTPGNSDDLVCDWLAGVSSNLWGHKDAHQNAVLWRNTVVDANLDLFVLSYLRSQKSTLKARADVLNRKGTIATKHGMVHRSLFDFSDLF